MIFFSNFPEDCSWASKKQYSSTGLDNGLAPTKQQVIIWTNDA